MRRTDVCSLSVSCHTPHGLAARLLYPERFGGLDNGPGRREAAADHRPTRAKCSCARRIAGLSGFFTLSQSRDGPDLHRGHVAAQIIAQSDRSHPPGCIKS
jgi:hypothetical protein